MVVVARPPANAFVAAARKVYHPLGFAKGYNFTLWFLFGGALVAFILARLMYLDVEKVFCAGGPSGALPGECYYYLHGLERVGIVMHLAGILPAGILVVLQFVPAIRHRLLIFHRISGYLIILLSFVGVAGVLMIARHALGGGLDLQSAAGLASVVFVSCKLIALYSIKKLQIEQHRAWMLRAWVIASFIITMRLIVLIMSKIVGRGGGEYLVVRPCAVVDSMFGGNQTTVARLYPGCTAYYAGTAPDAYVAVRADTTTGRPDQTAAAFGAGFGSSAFLALALHALGAELYLRLTPAEAARLRRVSYQRQLEAGMKNPGSAGLTAQSIGDAEPWSPEGPSAAAAAAAAAAVGESASAMHLESVKGPVSR
ncbi:Uncharacterized protein TCAP_00659 [Tolypocladium capitatum]|uniref:DUF2306 domain-containing protein n=1 Tax=Tolypocladium capitatum TaxID=45235 RepID=A0A2K3QPH0_9HYPO|nr:Uncharacterized protein TCAP_00659 [Tolypocladium capitatum]